MIQHRQSGWRNLLARTRCVCVCLQQSEWRKNRWTEKEIVLASVGVRFRFTRDTNICQLSSLTGASWALLMLTIYKMNLSEYCCSRVYVKGKAEMSWEVELPALWISCYRPECIISSIVYVTGFPAAPWPGTDHSHHLCHLSLVAYILNLYWGWQAYNHIQD